MDSSEMIKKVATNVRTLMNQKNLSNAALARNCRISTGTISKIIHGNMTLSVPMLIVLADGLGVHVNDILAGIVAPQTPNKLNTKKIDKNKNVFIGILSINNKRKTCIKDYAGNIIGTSELAGGLDLAETMPSVMQLIDSAVEMALHNNNKKSKVSLKCAHATIVLQSYEFEETRFKFQMLASKTFASVTLLPDWQITYLATFGKKPGISLVTDKGVSLSYFQNNQLNKIGGWKFPVYDIGGENWLGVEAIHHTIEAYEGLVPFSNLAQSVLSQYAGKIEKITEYCFKTGKNPDVYCEFANILLRDYLTGDSAAKKIVEHGFQEIYKGIKRVDDILGKQVKITVSGSLAKIYRSFIEPARLVQSPSDSKEIEILADLSLENFEKQQQDLD